MFFHHIMYQSPVSFLKDILPILISSFALIVSVVTPYLLIRYEKIYAVNKETREFMRQVEIYLLEWLNVTSNNHDLNAEFLEVLNTPNGVFTKAFQFYDFPTMEFFKSYNVDLVNEFYVQTRKLKNFNHHLRLIDKEYTAFKETVMNGGQIAINATNFFREALNELNKQYPEAIADITGLRVKVRLLLNRANAVDSLQVNKFFALGQSGRFWYKRDMKFTLQEIEGEKVALQKEQEDAREEKQ